MRKSYLTTLNKKNLFNIRTTPTEFEQRAKVMRRCKILRESRKDTSNHENVEIVKKTYKLNSQVDVINRGTQQYVVHVEFSENINFSNS